MKIYGRILWLIAVLSVVGVTTAFAIRPSGPGINTKSNSLSVAIATDQPSVPVFDVPSIIVPVTPSQTTDLTANCKDGLLVTYAGDGGNGNVYFQPANDASAGAALTLGAVVVGERIPVAVAKVLDGGTTASVYCLSH